MRMKKSGILLLLLMSLALPAAAQSNQLLDKLLDEKEARFADVVSLTLTAAKLLPETATPQEAIQTLQQQGWKVQVASADAPISLGDYSYLLMKAFKISGGVLYSLFPGPRYACRELGFLKIIPLDARPNRTVSGEEAIRILGNALARQGGGT